MSRTVSRVCVIGPGTRFLSGITYYTFGLCEALGHHTSVSAILLRRLLPTRLYPGRRRVGAPISTLRLPPAVAQYDGVDWFWGLTIVRAIRFLISQRPQVLILQWWTSTVFHSYLVLTLTARLLGAKVVIEFHEVLDTGEARLPVVRTYAHVLGRLLVQLAHGFVIHSEHDRPVLKGTYPLGDRPTACIPHGPYSHYSQSSMGTVQRHAPTDCCNLLFFGTIRPYKGLEDLIQAFDAIPRDDIDHYWLTVVGETWESWTLPEHLIAESQYRDRITFINHYVPDEEVAAYFAGADAVVLPYHRSSASGPLHIALHEGLPLVVTAVGGLVEAATDYDGAIMVPPHDPVALCAALQQVRLLQGQRFADPHSWSRTVAGYQLLFARILEPATVKGVRLTNG